LEPVVDIDAPGRDIGCADELHLLDLAVEHGRGPRQGVEMVFLERALRDLRRSNPSPAFQRSVIPEPLTLRFCPRHVAGHELDAGVFEILAAHVLQGDPADDVERVALFRRDGVVGGLPSHAARQIGELHVVPARCAGPQPP
jgi:hypothetical protein